MPLDIVDGMRRPDEVALYRGSHGHEVVSVFISRAADRPNHWRVRAVFSAPDGFPKAERVLHLDRTKPLAFTISRLGEPPFTFPPGGARAARDAELPFGQNLKEMQP